MPSASADNNRAVPTSPTSYCALARLVVEVDGGQHAGSADATRDAWLAAQGYRVLRFWNNDVLDNIDGVVETLRAAVTASRRSG